MYENPADESRAPELWSNSALWLKLEQLISLHTVTIQDLQQQMRDLSECEEFIKDDWFKDAPKDLDRIAELFDQEMVKPTANLSDLLYKSVEIRDSRHSLQLGTSMWRLSWITFIFLPLTFMAGVFGMNVDIFQPEDNHFPGLKWYFIVSIPFMEFEGQSFHCCTPHGTAYYEQWYLSGKCWPFAIIHPMKNSNESVWGKLADTFN